MLINPQSLFYSNTTLVKVKWNKTFAPAKKLKFKYNTC